MIYKRGKKPSRPLPAKAFLFKSVFNPAKLPTPPIRFGHQGLMGKEPWHMLGNDEYGNCVWAAKAHMQYLWSLLGENERVRITTADVLSDYAAQTGFSADNPDSDQGTDMQAAAEYHRLVGIRDARNIRHKVFAYVALEHGNVNQLALATYLFGAVEIGLSLPDDCDDLFEAGKVWKVSDSKPSGGHTVTIVGRDEHGNFIAVTWGKLQHIEPAFIAKYMDEGYAFLNSEILNLKGLSAEAYDKVALTRMLSQVCTSLPEEDVAAVIPPDVIAPLLTPTPVTPPKRRVPNQAQYDVAFDVLRAAVDKSGYGWALSDANLRTYSNAVTEGVVASGSI